jgi:Ca2+:H+ antiporter
MTAAKSSFKIEPLNWLLVALPAAIVLEVMHAPAVWVFIVSCLAIIPLAGLMGRATESLADTMGAGIGGLLNATFGNAAELIIALMALIKGPDMYPLVKASLTGSIIGNVLLVLGASMVVGGLKFKRQTFNRTAAGMGATLLALASFGLIIPTVYVFLLHGSTDAVGAASPVVTVDHLSEEIAMVLIVIYALSLLFSLGTHQHLFSGESDGQAGGHGAKGHDSLHWSRRVSVIVLVAATAGIALMSEFLVGSVEVAGEKLGMGPVFVGVIVVAIIGNAAEHSTAILMAMKNKMDLAVNIAVGSSLQIALFVAPVLVFASMAINRGHPMDLHFTALEVIAVVMSIGVLSMVSQDGESHWMEGVMLLGVYMILALAFFNLPTAI